MVFHGYRTIRHSKLDLESQNDRTIRHSKLDLESQKKKGKTWYIW